MTNQVEEFLAFFDVFKHTCVVHSLCDRALLLNAPHLDAHVLGLDHHDGAEWAEGLLKAVTNLLGQVFLYLQAMREDVHHAWYLAETYNVAIGDISHVNLAEEGKDVVLAERVELDVLDHNHLVVVLMEHGRFEGGNRIHRIALGKFEECACQPFRCALQSFSCGVFADGFEVLDAGVFQYFNLFFSIHFAC